MNISDTIHALYAISCEAEQVAIGGKEDTTLLKNLIFAVRSNDVQKSLSDLMQLMGTLQNLSSNLKNMHIIDLSTGADTINKLALLHLELVFGASTVKTTTAFDAKGAQSIVDGLSMVIKMIQPESNVSLVGGNA